MTRHFKSLSLIVLACVLLLSSGCGKKEEQQPADQSQSTPSPAQQSAPSQPETTTPWQGSAAEVGQMPNANEAAPGMDMEQLAAQNAEMFKAMNQGKDIKPVSPDKLKGFLPETVAGMKRGRSDGRQVDMMGVKVASAQADYTAGENGTLELMVMDVGNISGPMRMGMTNWAMMQIDRQTDTGYEKTTTYKGYKAIEEYDRQSRHGEFRVFVADRFIVEITGDNVTMETIKKIMTQIDLKKLAQSVK